MNVVLSALKNDESSSWYRVSGTSGTGVAATISSMSVCICATSSAASAIVAGESPRAASIWSYVSLEGECGRAVPRVDVDAPQLLAEAGEVATGQHEIGLVRGDGLDVRFVARQLVRQLECLGRIVGEVVDGDELVARTDGEHDLGVGRAQRHDALSARRVRRSRRAGRFAAGSVPTAVTTASLVDRSCRSTMPRCVGRIARRVGSLPQPGGDEGETDNDADHRAVDRVPVEQSHDCLQWRWRTSWVTRRRCRCEPSLASRD